MDSIAAILAELPRLKAMFEREAWVASSVSAWSIGQHLDHVIKVHGGIIDLCVSPLHGSPCAQGITLIGRLALMTGHLTRGKGRAPARVMPDPLPATALHHALAQIQSRLMALGSHQLPGDPAERFHHPVFGGLTRRQWLRFAEIHQRHHLKIINDIVRAMDA